MYFGGGWGCGGGGDGGGVGKEMADLWMFYVIVRPCSESLSSADRQLDGSARRLSLFVSVALSVSYIKPSDPDNWMPIGDLCEARLMSTLAQRKKKIKKKRRKKKEAPFIQT